MQIVSFTSLKGGAGKTTSLMVVASALVEKNLRVGLVEADDNGPLGTWREYGLDFEAWNDENCAIYVADGPEALRETFSRAEKEGIDILLVDTRGGGSDFNDIIMLNSDLVVIPTSLGVMEMDEALQGLDFALQTLKTSTKPIPAAILANRVSSAKKMPAAHREAIDLLKGLPCFSSTIKKRQAFEDIKATGLLGLYLKKLEAAPNQRLQTLAIREYLEEGRAVADELLEQLQPVEAA